MNIRTLLAAACLAATAPCTWAGTTVLSEGFDDVSSLTLNGWVIKNESTPGPGPLDWFQGLTTDSDGNALAAPQGVANSYIATNWQSGHLDTQSGTSSGTLSNWLMLPVLTLSNGMKMDFSLRLLAGNNWLDTVEVYYSATGSATDTSAFTLLDSYSSRTDTGWTDESVTLGGLGGDVQGRFAFRYFVNDLSLDGNYVGIDSVNVVVPAEDVPEPATLSLVALALAGTAVSTRRRKAA